MNKEQSRVKMGSLMALVLFVLFAVCVLAVLLTGADVYKRLVERDRNSYDRRTAVSYLTTKVRQADRLESVEIQEFGGLETLVLSEKIEGADYATWIYCYDGYIRELFAAADTGLMPDAGDKVLEAQALSFGWEEDFLCVEITAPDGVTQSLKLHLRSGKEVTP